MQSYYQLAGTVFDHSLTFSHLALLIVMLLCAKKA